MAKKHHPKRGSMQFWPRARSKKRVVTPRSFPKINEQKILGFIGYKAGMTHVWKTHQDWTPLKKKYNRAHAATVIECPPMKIYSIRLYKENEDGYKIISEIFNHKLEKEVVRKTKPSKKTGDIKDFDFLRVVVYTQPKLTGIGKKKPDFVELAVGGNKEEQIEYLKSLFDKEIKISDLIQPGDLIDTRSVTRGRGFTGVIQKFGLKLRQHKSEKGTRRIGNMGAWTPKRVEFTVPQGGKWGNHKRTEYNKEIFIVGDKPEEINQKGGFLHYGNIKNDYIVVKGSVSGKANSPITLSLPIRKPTKFKQQTPDITYVSQESKQ